MLEAGLILWPVVQRKWKENVGERAERGPRDLCVTTYDSRLLSVVHSWYTQQRQVLAF